MLYSQPIQLNLVQSTVTNDIVQLSCNCMLACITFNFYVISENYKISLSSAGKVSYKEGVIVHENTAVMIISVETWVER